MCGPWASIFPHSFFDILPHLCSRPLGQLQRHLRKLVVGGWVGRGLVVGPEPERILLPAVAVAVENVRAFFGRGEGDLRQYWISAFTDISLVALKFAGCLFVLSSACKRVQPAFLCTTYAFLYIFRWGYECLFLVIKPHRLTIMDLISKLKWHPPATCHLQLCQRTIFMARVPQQFGTLQCSTRHGRGDRLQRGCCTRLKMACG